MVSYITRMCKHLGPLRVRRSKYPLLLVRDRERDRQTNRYREGERERGRQTDRDTERDREEKKKLFIYEGNR